MLPDRLPGLSRPFVNGHEAGDGELILKHAGKLGFEGVVSKTIDAPYAPGNRGLWRKANPFLASGIVTGWRKRERVPGAAYETRVEPGRSRRPGACYWQRKSKERI